MIIPTNAGSSSTHYGKQLNLVNSTFQPVARILPQVVIDKEDENGLGLAKGGVQGRRP
jgi:hypothetical protein